MHRITDNRMVGLPYRNLQLFGALCGDKAMEKVMLVTTMWDRIDRETGKGRECELVTRFWAKCLEHHAHHDRFDNAEPSAWRIIQYFVHREALRQVLLLQEELVDLKKHINETTAGRILYNDSLELLEKQKRDLCLLGHQVQQNPILAAAVEAEIFRTGEDIESTLDQLAAWKISFSRKVALLFKKQPKAVRIVG